MVNKVKVIELMDKHQWKFITLKEVGEVGLPKLYHRTSKGLEDCWGRNITLKVQFEAWYDYKNYPEIQKREDWD